LSEGVILKHNHIALAGGIAAALERAHHNRRGEQPIEIEIHTLEALEEALQHGAEAILLDHMSVEEVRRAVERVNKHTRRLSLECSGGITLENVRAYADTGVEFISVGALTHSARSVDMSMRVVPG
jgi:nicotinate-nucleotide pyrophosphorylase (carboxylating)